MKLRTVAAIVAAGFVFSACGGDGGDASSKPDPDATVAIDLGDDSIEVLGVFEISDDDTISGADDDQQEVFDRFTEVIPAEYRPEVTHFVSISQEGSAGTDGAMQNPVDDDEAPIYDEFYLALDTTGSSTGAELDRTMVHEFAHLLTLRPGQITPLTAEEEASDEPVECAVYAVPECPTDDSYLTDYFTQFEYEEDAEYDPEVYPTEYAATIPTEDVAEVFAEWILSDADARTVSDDGEVRDVVPGSVLDEKFDFFDDYPELVQMRDDIRAGLAA